MNLPFIKASKNGALKMAVYFSLIAALGTFATALHAQEIPPRNEHDRDIVSEGIASAAPSGPMQRGWAASLEIQNPAVLSQPIAFAIEARNEFDRISYLQYGPFMVQVHGTVLKTGNAIPERQQAPYSFSYRSGGRPFDPNNAVIRRGDLRDRFVFPGPGKFKIWAEVQGLDISDAVQTKAHHYVILITNKFDLTVTSDSESPPGFSRSPLTTPTSHP
jgi:hypothetical protein